MALTAAAVETRLRERFPDVPFRRQEGAAVRDHTVYVPAERIVEVCTFLRDDPGLDFAMLSWLGGVDWLPREPRFEVVYHLLSIKYKHRIRVKAQVTEEEPTIASATPLYRGWNWFEREAFDMYGVRFEGHPDLRRMFMYDQFQGHPLSADEWITDVYTRVDGRWRCVLTHLTPVAAKAV